MVYQHGLPTLRNRHEDLLNQIAILQGEKVALSTEILGLRNSVHTYAVVFLHLCLNCEIQFESNVKIKY
jgi:hypothetical protein